MDLKPLFEPKTMAVIGISSSNDRHPANVIFAKNHLRYPVEVYAVNPKGGKLHSETYLSECCRYSSKDRFGRDRYARGTGAGCHGRLH